MAKFELEVQVQEDWKYDFALNQLSQDPTRFKSSGYQVHDSVSLLLLALTIIITTNLILLLLHSIWYIVPPRSRIQFVHYDLK